MSGGALLITLKRITAYWAAGLTLAATAYASVDVNNYCYLTGADGARATGMGGAGYALAEGYEGILTNPAGLATTPFPQINGDWSWYGGYKSGALNLAGWGFGVGGRFGRLSRSFGDSYPPFTAFGEYAGELAAGYGRMWGSRTAFGGSLELLLFSNNYYSSSALALDVGCKHKLLSNLTLAAGLRNLGGRLKWELDLEGGKEPEARHVPAFVVAGVGWSLANGKLLLAADGYLPVVANEFDGAKGDPFYTRAGLEYRPWSWLAFRTGYRGGLNEIGQGLTFGIVFRLSDFDVDAGGAPSSNRLTYVSHGGEEKKMPPGSGGISLSYNIGRSKAAGAAEATKLLNEEFERQKGAVVGQLLLQAEGFAAEGRFEDAQDTLNIILVWDPDNERAVSLFERMSEAIIQRDAAGYLEKAKGYLEAGKSADAAVEAKAALVLIPDNGEAAAILAEAQSNLDAENARAAEEIRLLLAEGQRYYEQGKDALAIASWSAVLVREPGNEIAYESLAAARVRLDEKVAAEIARGAAAETAGRYPEALRRYREAKKLDPAHAETGAAIERVEAAAAAQANALADQAESALGRGDYDRAQDLAYEALANKPGLFRAEAVIAKVTAESMKTTAKAKTAPEDYNAIYLKGIAAYTAHNYAAAIAYWGRIPPESTLYSKAAQNIERARKILQKLNG